MHLHTPTPTSDIPKEEVLDAFPADLAEVSSLPVSSLLLVSRSFKRPSIDSSVSPSKIKHSTLSFVPLTQDSLEAAVPPPHHHPNNVPLNVKMNLNPFGRITKSLPSSSSSLSDLVNETFLKTLRDTGLECPICDPSARIHVSFPARLTNIDGVISAKMLTSIVRAEDWVNLQQLS